MLDTLHYDLLDFVTSYEVYIPSLRATYQLFDKPLGTAPVVVVNHAFTGNSQVAGENGWWAEIVGAAKAIDTDIHIVVAFNIPDNGFHTHEEDVITNYQYWVTVDVTRSFSITLKEHLGLNSVFMLIGCSLGGDTAWEMTALTPDYFQQLVVVAADWKAIGWIVGNCLLQEQILKNSTHPLHDTRLHAILYYRAPRPLEMKFEHTIHLPTQLHNVESWLLHHGEELNKRFSLSAYKLTSQLVKIVDISRDRGSLAGAVTPITAHITIVSTDSDLYFVPQENHSIVTELHEMDKPVDYYGIHSIHGHDTFLVKHKQLEQLLKKIF